MRAFSVLCSSQLTEYHWLFSLSYFTFWPVKESSISFWLFTLSCPAPIRLPVLLNFYLVGVISRLIEWDSITISRRYNFTEKSHSFLNLNLSLCFRTSEHILSIISAKTTGHIITIQMIFLLQKTEQGENFIALNCW